mgnify:CR=1 FL=1
MAGAAEKNVTVLLRHLRDGDDGALDRLLPLVYGELRALAACHMKGERKDHTLQPTALVHEAYLRLVQRDSPDWEDRAHFFGVASQVIRRILVEHARAKLREKRGGGAVQVTLNEQILSGPAADLDVLALDEALEALQAEDPRKARAIELRYFGGLNLEEIAAVTDVSIATVHRDLRMATAWLLHRLDEAEA